MGMPDVFELTIEPGRRTASRRSSRSRLTSSRSTTASMIQSASAIRAKSVSKPAGADERDAVGGEERIRLERPRPLEPLPRDVGRQIQQQ